MAEEAKSEPASTTKPAAKKQPKPIKKSGRKRRAKAKSSPAAKPNASPTVRAKSTSKPRARRKESTPAERAKVLGAADREGLTALQVQKRFGVKPVTYYSWRKKLGVKGRRGRRPVRAAFAQSPDLSAQVRSGVQSRVREMLPTIVREEVGRYLDQVLGGTTALKRGPGRPRKSL